MTRRKRGLQGDADALHEERSLLRLELTRAAERLERLAERDSSQRDELLERARIIRDKLRDSEDRDAQGGRPEPPSAARDRDAGDPAPD